MSDHGRRNDGRRGNDRSARILGNLLIILGVTLFGATLSFSSVRADAVPFGQTNPAHTDASAPPLISALPPTAVAATPHAQATPGWQPVLRAPVASPAATPGLSAAPAATPATVAPTSTPVATPAAAVPRPPATRIQIPSVGIDTRVVDVGFDVVTIQGQQLIQWRVADYAAGHQSLSANPGEGGNIVISGHDDYMGEVFRNLYQVKVGDQVILSTADGPHRYAITEVVYRKEVGVPLSDRLATGLYLAPMPEERLTLVTCWPYGVDDHRLIVIAKPINP